MTDPIFLILLGVLVVAVIVFLFRQRSSGDGNTRALEDQVKVLQVALDRIESSLREELRTNREESTAAASANRTELTQTITGFKAELTGTLQAMSEMSQRSLTDVNTTLEQRSKLLVETTQHHQKQNQELLLVSFKDSTSAQILQLDKMMNGIQEALRFLADQAKKDSTQLQERFDSNMKNFKDYFEKSVNSLQELQKEKFGQLESKQIELVKTTETRLDVIRSTVEEKLEKTLTERLGHSFETVGKQLIEVQKGLGEMQILAQDVGGLKRVLSNVKMRGGIGEIQLSMLLEQILAPEQYQANVKIKPNTTESVEFAVKLPGRDDIHSQLWLPIDAKFPKDIYEKLQTAYDTGDTQIIEAHQKELDLTIRKMAKDIRDKYIDPPQTTDFAIMFLPFEGIYGEVVRKASLLDELQRTYRVIVTGPTTLAAILNSLQLGFKTLAIQKRSSEVWQVLGAVKKEFENFGVLLAKAQKNIQTGMSQLDDVMDVRTRAIQRRLKTVEALSEADAKILLPLSEVDSGDDEG